MKFQYIELGHRVPLVKALNARKEILCSKIEIVLYIVKGRTIINIIIANKVTQREETD